MERGSAEAAVAEELVAATGYGEAARLNAVRAGERGQGLVESPMPSQVLPGSAAAPLLSPPIASPLSADDGPRLYVPTDEIVNEIASMQARRCHGRHPSRPWPPRTTALLASRLTTVGWTMLRPTSRRRSRRARRWRWRRWRRHWGRRSSRWWRRSNRGLDSLLRALRDQIVATDYADSSAPPRRRRRRRRRPPRRRRTKTTISISIS